MRSEVKYPYAIFKAFFQSFYTSSLWFNFTKKSLQCPMISVCITTYAGLCWGSHAIVPPACVLMPTDFYCIVRKGNKGSVIIKQVPWGRQQGPIYDSGKVGWWTGPLPTRSACCRWVSRTTCLLVCRPFCDSLFYCFFKCNTNKILFNYKPNPPNILMFILFIYF